MGDGGKRPKEPHRGLSEGTKGTQVLLSNSTGSIKKPAQEPAQEPRSLAPGPPCLPMGTPSALCTSPPHSPPPCGQLLVGSPNGSGKSVLAGVWRACAESQPESARQEEITNLDFSATFGKKKGSCQHLA